MANTDLATILEQISNASVLCVGDVMLDCFVEGSVDRISPEAPIPVLSVSREQRTLGGAANVARNVSALGAKCHLIGVLGQDHSAEAIQTMIRELPDSSADFVISQDRPTTVKMRFVAGWAQLLRADWEKKMPLPAAATQDLQEKALAALTEAGALVLSDYGKGVLSTELVFVLVEAAKTRNCPVVVDPKGRDFSKYRGADLVTPNRTELALASGLPINSDATVVAACRKVAETCGLGGILATRSEQGMTLYQRKNDGESLDHLPARAREVFDVAGAGDTVVAGLAAGLAAGLKTYTAATLANRTAGIVVGKARTAVAYPGEVLNDSHEESFHAGEAKLATPAEAADRVAEWRRLGKKIGFTNGCFDLLHPGHVSLIDRAHDTCDRLVVGLNSDASVRRLKGADRPVQPESARAAVLAALSHVDMVVVFGEDTPLDLIRTLEPDVLVKGADYTEDQVVGAKDVKSWGGRVMLAELVDGHSTTDTIARIAPKD